MSEKRPTFLDGKENNKLMAKQNHEVWKGTLKAPTKKGKSIL